MIENIIEKINSKAKKIKKYGILSRLLAAISYLGVFSLIPFIFKVKNEYVRFHAKQGLFLFLVEICSVLIWVIPFVGWIIGFVSWILCFVLSLMGLVNGIIGREWKIPFLHRFANRVKF
jgi:uncharacterized membrane protein